MSKKIPDNVVFNDGKFDANTKNSFIKSLTFCLLSL